MADVIKTVAEYQADIAGASVPYNAADNVVLEDSAVNLAALTTGQIADLLANHVDSILSDDNAIHWDLAQWQALGGAFDFNGALLALYDTGANLGAIDPNDLANLAALEFVQIVDASDDAVTFTTAQLLALRDNGVALTYDDVVTVSDPSLPNEEYYAMGVDIIGAPPTFKTVAEYQADIASAAVPYADADQIIIEDSAANLANLTPSDIGDLFLNGVDSIKSDDNLVQWDVAQWQALGSPFEFNGASLVLFDTGANISGLSAGWLLAIAGLGVGTIDASDDAVSFTDAQLDAINGSMALTPADTVTLSDNSANIDVTAGGIASYSNQGVDIIDATDDGPFSLTAESAGALAASSLAFDASDSVTLSDFGSLISALGLGIAQLGPKGVDVIDAVDDALTLSAAQFSSLGTVSLVAGDTVVIADTGAQLATLNFADLAPALVDRIDATDNQLKITVAQYNALGSVILTAADTVTILDTGANIATLSQADMGELGGHNVDVLDASDNVLSLSAAQLDALGTVALTPADTVSLLDTRAVIEALGSGALGEYAAQGVDILDSTSGVLHMDADQVAAVVAQAGLTFASADNVVLVDSGANVKASLAGAYDKLALDHVDSIDLTDNAISLSVSELQSLGAVGFAADDTDVAATDSEANLEALSNAALAALATQGVDRLDASDTDAVTFTAGKYTAMGAITFTTTDTVVVTGTGAQLAALTGLSAHHVDRIDATDDKISLSISQINALGSTQLTAADTVTLADSSTNIEALNFAQATVVASAGVDVIDATDNHLELSASQINGWTISGSTVFAAADTVSLLDTETTIEGLSLGVLGEYAAAGVDILDSTNDVLHMDASQVGLVLNQAGLTFASGDNVVLTDSSTNITGSLTGSYGDLAGDNVDSIDLTDNAISLSVNELLSLGTVGFAADDTDVAAADSEADLEAMGASDLTALAALGVDRLDATDTDAVSFTTAQYTAMGSMAFTAGDTTVVTGTGAQLAALTLSGLSGHHVDSIDATDDQISLSISQVNSLGSTQLTAADVVTLADSSTNIEALNFNQATVVAAAGIDVIDATDDHLELTASQINGWNLSGALTFADADTITLEDSSTNVLSAFGSDFSKLVDMNVDIIGLTDNAINIDLDQVDALGPIHFAANDTDVALLDTGAKLGALDATDLLAAADVGVDRLDASDDAATFSIDQLNNIIGDGMALTAGDVITIADTGAAFAALSPGEIGHLATDGVDQIDLTDNSIIISGAQYEAFADNFVFQVGDLVRVKAGGAADDFHGGVERDIFLGKHGDDVLDGGAGNDSLKGGGGADVLTGGTGNDSFIFSTTSQSKPGQASDLITDLENNDKIDLHRIDADVNTGGDQAFTIVTAFTHHAGELLIKYNAAADVTIFKLDVNGDGVADAEIRADGDHHDFTNFLL